VVRLALLTILCFAGCTSPDRNVGERRDDILGGAADPSTNSVFLLDLRFDSGAAICSAVLISSKTLLTAAHCVDRVYHSSTAITVRATNKPDTSMLMMSDMIDVTATGLHPMWSPSVQQSEYDLAVIALARAPDGVTPVTLLRALPANAAGQSVRVVGYGRTSAGDATSNGTRRSVTTPIVAVTSTDFTLGTAGSVGICSGDSGGPSFLGAAVAGIHSNAESSCGRGTDIRVDTNLSFIEGFVQANDPPSCVADGRCAIGCTTTDPDCPCQANSRCEAGCGLSDVDCGDDGAVCMQGSECASEQCVDDPRGFKFCSRSCTTTAECQNQMTCQSGVCRAAPEMMLVGDDVKGGCSSVPGVPFLLILLALRRRK
jgi:V8-like Glu-specific endopeptidase